MTQNAWILDESRLISQDAAFRLLEPLFPIFATSYETAWREWDSICKANPLRTVAFTSRTRASVINDLVVQEAQSRLQKVPGVRISRLNGVFVATVQDTAMLRFKKLDKRYQSRSILTIAQQRMLYQLPLPGLPPEATGLVAGYRINAITAEMLDVSVTCPIGQRVKWIIPVPTAAAPATIPLASLNEGVRPPVYKPKEQGKDAAEQS
jgi:hypothetical protein